MWLMVFITSVVSFATVLSSSTTFQDDPKLRLSVHPDWEGSGLVEVFMHGQWGRVCDNEWDVHDADVVCRQLGFSGAEQSTCCGRYFGKGSGPPLMASVNCKGEESSLFNCSYVAKDGASCKQHSTAGVICKLDKPNVRLVGSPLVHAGIVQIRNYGRWGSSCDWSWGLTQGHVVCRELGYRRAIFITSGGVFERKSAPIWIKKANCTGNESSIFHCDLKYMCSSDKQYADCLYLNHIDGVICESNKELAANETAAVRLNGSKFSHMGRVEIKQYGIWHAVCSIGWDKLDADVVCRQLGFPEAVVEVGHGQFGSGSGPMWLTSIGCQGNESSLDQCVSAGWELEADCGKRYGAGVICKMDNITGDGEIRLRGSNKRNTGRVEIQLGGVWGTVALKDSDIRDGNVLCRQLGYHKAVRMIWLDKDVGMQLMLSNLHCKGDERNILDCPRELDYYISKYNDNIGVECTNDTNYKSGLEVRLFGMNTPNVGYLEVKYNGTWGVICMLSPQWTYRLAEVICRQLHLGPPLNDSFLSKKCPHSIQSTNTTWLTVINCQGFEASLDQCPLKVLGRIDDIDCGACQVCSVCLICQPQHASFTDPTTTVVNIPRVSPTVTFKISRTSSETRSTRGAMDTRKLLPTRTSTTQGPLSTSTPSTANPPDKCPNMRCQNYGSCEQVKNTWKCHCLESFAGEYCEVFVGPNTVSIVLKMTLNRWNSSEFQWAFADILTSHCRQSICLDETNDKEIKKRQKRTPGFQPDEVLILQGYPIALQGTPLLNVRLAVRSNNEVIPKEILHTLVLEVAPELHRRIGHDIAYIDRMEVDLNQATSVSPKALGRNSDRPDLLTSYKHALIVLGVLLGVVFLVAIVTIVVFHFRKKKREKILDQSSLEENFGENNVLMPL